MCTVAMFICSNGHMFLAGNRDESRARGRALPPRDPTQIGPRIALFPVDADAHGTWIGVNDAAIALTLLNNYQDTAPLPPHAEIVSRGVLARELLGATSLAEVAEMLRDRDLGHIRPFMLCAGTPLSQPHALLATWTGRRLEIKEAGLPLLLISSGYQPEEVTTQRTRALAALMSAEPPTDPEEVIAAFAQASPEPGPFTVSMSREDACTVSHTLIELDAERARMIYLDGPPHTSPTRHVATLPLRLN